MGLLNIKNLVDTILFLGFLALTYAGAPFKICIMPVMELMVLRGMYEFMERNPGFLDKLFK